MDRNAKIWQQYYNQVLHQPHSDRTEKAVKLNRSGVYVAIDCGCGTGGDMAYISQQGYTVHGFDSSSDAVAICQERFAHLSSVTTTLSSFEDFDYPRNGLTLAHSSLYFADPAFFDHIWRSLTSSISRGGVFSGDFMGIHDSWAAGFRCPTSPFHREEIINLFTSFEIVDFQERDEWRKTSLGKDKHWHTFSVIAIKRCENTRCNR